MRVRPFPLRVHLFEHRVADTTYDRIAWQRRHHEQWGRTYEAKDVKIEWHVPSQLEIDFAIELLREIVVPALDTVEGLLKEAEEGGARSSTWTNDFCRVSVLVSISR